MAASNDWQRTRAIFERALAIPAEERSAFLAASCGDDEALRRRVLGLLNSYDRAPDFLETPVDVGSVSDPPARDLTGAALGVYQLESRLGSGGMGEVYRAHDTRLNRTVAIKVLPLHLAADPAARERFRREAQMLAAINHPNIAAIYGLEEANASQFLILELVGGETLDRRITRGAIPVDEALAIANRVAEALEAAHEKGIIHRDLKPSNIAFTEDGQVKVLDFGLAKLATSQVASDTVSDKTPAALYAHLTDAGSLLGTPAYMSPEQVQGRPADKRSDVWAFGCVLLEMLTGKRAFEGDSVPDVLAAVINRDVYLPATIPAGVQHVIRGCLRKDYKRRLRDIGDARLEIEEVIAGTALAESKSVNPVSSRGTRWTRAGGLTATFVAGVAVAGVVAWLLAHPAEPRVARLLITPTGSATLAVNGYTGDVAISPDGRQIAYVGGNGTDLLVRALDRVEPRVFKGIGMPHHPFFSPDGAWIGFFDGGGALKKVSIDGGPPIMICRMSSPPTSATWGADDTIVYTTANLSLGLVQVPAGGGEPATLTKPETHGDDLYNSVHFLPGASAVLFTMRGGSRGTQVLVFDLRTHRQKIVIDQGYDARYLPTGHLVYGVNGTLQIVPFDLDRLEVVGKPIAVMDSVLTTPYGGLLDLDVSDSGTLVYVPVTAQVTGRMLVWVDREGHEEPIPAPVRAYTYSRLSPDGARVASDVRDQEIDIWIWDFAREALTRFTFGPAFDQYPLWTPDGSRLIFDSSRIGTVNLFWQAADGAGSAERLTTSQNPQFAYTISPDGTQVVFREDFPSTGQDLMLLRLDDGHQVTPLLQTSFNELNAEISPDGRWLAYESNESGEYEVYVRPFPSMVGGKWQVSSGGGGKPLWSRNGQELFYLTPAGALMGVRIEHAETFTTSAPTRLLDGGYYTGRGINVGRTYDVSPDGRRFLMLKLQAEVPPSLVVVQQWFSELRRLSPTR